MKQLRWCTRWREPAVSTAPTATQLRSRGSLCGRKRKPLWRECRTISHQQMWRLDFIFSHIGSQLFLAWKKLCCTADSEGIILKLNDSTQTRNAKLWTGIWLNGEHGIVNLVGLKKKRCFDDFLVFYLPQQFWNITCQFAQITSRKPFKMVSFESTYRLIVILHPSYLYQPRFLAEAPQRNRKKISQMEISFMCHSSEIKSNEPALLLFWFLFYRKCSLWNKIIAF